MSCLSLSALCHLNSFHNRVDQWSVLTLTYLLFSALLGSEEILEIAEATISAILAACRDFWQIPRFCNTAVNLWDCPRISDYTHQLICTLLHINWKWLNDRMSYMLKCLYLKPDRRTVTEPLWNNVLVMLLLDADAWTVTCSVLRSWG